MGFIETLQKICLLSPILSGCGFLLGVLFYKKLPGFYKSLAVFLGLMLLSDRFFDYVGDYLGYNYMFQPHYALVELIFFIIFFHKYLLSKKYLLLRILEIAAITYIAAEAIYYSFVFVSVEDFQTYAKPLDNFIVILLIMTYFYERANTYSASSRDYLWFSIVALIYFVLSTFIYLPYNFIINTPTNLIYAFWFINILVVIMFYGFITYKIIKQIIKPATVKK